jgi:hypothetical protein
VRCAAWLAGCLGLLAAASAGAGELRRVEAVGAVGLAKEGWSAPPRDAALERALRDALARVAREELGDPDQVDPEALAAALGDDPYAYASRFRILEDRGERPALLVDEPGIEREYVVVVEAWVDADRVRERLSAAGLLEEPAGGHRRSRLRVAVRNVRSHADYAAIRAALIEPGGALSVTPLEIERGQALFEVVSERSAARTLDALLAASGPALRIVPIEQDEDSLVLRMERAPEPAGAEPGPIDTTSPNRY